MTALPNLTVTVRGGGRRDSCRMELLDRSALPAVLDLQRTSHGTLMHPLTAAELEAMLGDGGRVLGAFLDDRLVAFLAILFPGNTPGNLGHDYGLTGSRLERAIHFTGVLVHPDLRGNRLHPRMIEMAARSVLSPTHHRCSFATVRPENIASVRGMLSAGMRIFARKPKHDGHDRFLFVRDLDRDDPPAAMSFLCPLTDHAIQRLLFSRGFQAVAGDAEAQTLAFAHWGDQPTPTGDDRTSGERP